MENALAILVMLEPDGAIRAVRRIVARVRRRFGGWRFVGVHNGVFSFEGCDYQVKWSVAVRGAGGTVSESDDRAAKPLG